MESDNLSSINPLSEISSPIKVLIAGGGTGGHIMPALAICEALIKRGIRKSNIEFLGSKNGQDRRLLRDTDFKLHELDNRPLNRKLNKELFSAIILMIRSLIGGYGIVKIFKPDVVVAVGGFASVPGIIGSKLNGIPIIQVNLDKAPGLAVRFGSLFAKVVADGFTETGLRRSVFVGVPLRADIVKTSEDRQAMTRERFEDITGQLRLRVSTKGDTNETGPKNSTSDRTVVLMGGSLGAKALNELGPALADTLNSLLQAASGDITRINIVHIAGNRGINEMQETLDFPSNYLLKGFEPRMDLLYQIADLIICRAGASTVAEILAAGIPSILIPLPNAPRNHQYYNAKTYEKLGACIVLEQKDLNLDMLSLTVWDLLNDPIRLERMSRSAREAGVTDASSKIADIIISQVDKN